VWALNGDTAFATTRVRTNTTAFVSSGELIASITIEGEATLDLYDIVVVTPAGKKGIGIELFEVTPEIIDLGAGPGSTAYAVNDLGQVVGDGGGTAFLWENGALRYLGVLPGHTHSFATDINEGGQVVGTSSGGTVPSRAFIWTEASGMQALPGTLGGTQSEAWAINESGDVVGASTLPGDTIHHAVVWRNGMIIDIQAPSFPAGKSYAWEINESGEVVGTIYTNPQSSFRWTTDSGMQLIAATPESNSGEALGINNNGMIVGWKPSAAGEPPTAYTWNAGSFLHLGTLGGRGSVAMAVNDLGAVVGRAETGTRHRQQVGFIWTPGTGMKSLGVPSGRDNGWAMDINETGSVVGQTWGSSGGESRATLWRFP
jgi:probable HAF family extracellular repeat protein